LYRIGYTTRRTEMSLQYTDKGCSNSDKDFLSTYNALEKQADFIT